MILIEEISPAIKLSGTSSFLVSFNFNPALVNAIKTLPLARWDKKISKWEISKSELDKALDALTFFDDITLKLLPEKTINLQKSTNLTETEIKNFKYKPFDHQIEGINFLLAQGKSLLLDSMGVGKSLEMMYYAETLHSRGLIDHCLIICGVDSLRTNWKKEIKKFSKLSCRVLGERITRTGTIRYATIGERALELKEPIEEFFVIVNIASLRSDDVLEAFKKSSNKFGLICVDEIHKVATKSSQQGSNLLKLFSDYKVGATGTLLTNSPISCYVPLYWIEQDNATLTNFKAQYCTFGGWNGREVIGYKNLDLLKEELEDCSIRRTFSDISKNMPTKTVETELVEMEPGQLDFYNAIKKGVKEEADKINLNANNLLALTTRLRQATSCPTVLTTQEIDSAKIDRAAELVEELVDQNEKVVVLGTFKESIYKLGKKLERYNPLIVTGDTNEQEASASMDKFQEDQNFKVFIGTHAKVGTGFSLPVAHYMIMLDTPFTHAQFSQSSDRIYRITSDQNVFIKVLLTANTIDEHIWNIVEFKRELSDYVIDGKENSISESLKDELLKIITNL